MSNGEMVRVVWGLAGSAENAKLLPLSTPEVVKALEANDFHVEAPEYDIDHLASIKSPVWLAPIIEISSTVSTGVLVQVISGAVIGKFKKRKEQQSGGIIRIKIRRVLESGEVLEMEAEGNENEVRRQIGGSEDG